MKILQIIPNLNTGGAEKFCIDLSNELSKGHEVVLCSMFDITDSMILPKQITDRVRVETLGKKLGFDIRMFFKILRVIRKEKPDVLHTHLKALFYSSLGILAHPELKVFHTIHNVATKEAGSFFRRIYKWLFGRKNVTPVAISDTVLDGVQKEYGSRHSLCIPNGVALPKVSEEVDDVCAEVDSYRINESTTVLLNVGRLAPQKNQLMLRECFEELGADSNCCVLIIGDDPSLDRGYEKQLKSHQVENVHYLGAKTNIADYLTAVDGFCLSSEYEGLPITLLEACAMGKVSICTPVGGIPDVICSLEYGVLAKSSSKADFKNAVEQFLKIPQETRGMMEKNVVELFNRNYSISLCAERYLKAYGAR